MYFSQTERESWSLESLLHQPAPPRTPCVPLAPLVTPPYPSCAPVRATRRGHGTKTRGPRALVTPCSPPSCASACGSSTGAGPSSGAAASPSGQQLGSCHCALRPIVKRATQGPAPLEPCSQLSLCRGGNGAGSHAPPNPTRMENKRKIDSLADEQPMKA